MSANAAPSEDDVSLFCDIITGLSRTEAIARLKANNNDIQRATEEYFENPESTKYKWDESHFTDVEDNNAGVSFNIQGPDELAPPTYHDSTAPTRPPSRANNRSPLVEGAPTNHAEEDAALQRALAESAAESGVAPQETGVVDNSASVKYFGPANRTDYDSSQWAMVPTKASTETTTTDPRPSLRKRQPVRNILLSFPTPARSYGHNSEWWKGQPILKPEALAAMMRGEQVEGDDAYPAFNEELHRLMAFLDKTDRSYCAVDALIGTRPIDPSGGRHTWGVDYETKFLDHIFEMNHSIPGFDVAPMISVGELVPASSPASNESSDDSEALENEQNSVNFGLLDIHLDHDQWSWVNSLYDALDQLLWAQAIAPEQSAPESAGIALLVRPAEVITMRFNGAGLQKPCEIPAAFYADRYMETRQDLARHFQRQIHAIRRNGLQELARWEGSRVMCRGEPGCSKVASLDRTHDIRSCRAKIIENFEVLIDQQRKNAQWRHYEDQWNEDIPYSMNDLRLVSTWTGPFQLTAEESSKQKKWERIIEAARDELEQLDREMAGEYHPSHNDGAGITVNVVYKEIQEEFLEQLEVLSKRLTCQEHEVDDERFVHRNDPEAYHPEYWNPSQKYLLRGVALGEVTYVCVRGEADLIDIGQESKPNDQWWKIECPDDTSPTTFEKVSLEDVLQAAKTGSQWPMLVYATEKALEATPIPPSDALRMFVKADNRSFQQELAQEQNQEQTHEDEPPPLAAISADTLSHIPVASPAKRKHSASSSVATNGSSQGGLDDVDLTFSDDRDPFDGDDRPTTSHREFANASPQSNKLGGIVESLANCRTNESPGGGRSEQGHASSEGLEVEMQETPSQARAPEMQERAGGPAPFFGAHGIDNNATNGTVDSMDMDVDLDHPDGQP
ncbi:hypothetical protein DL762_003284 [Monosporascus cannonballus]|uniref:UBA domain-containing protein n=1 Tax=Monosporascus cannonballus TaxID=155416 RepID=A0ABY0HFE2_9PEZI|nr:hypothetical protein DL762_003284 [Monosporascus cannonballus]